MAPAVSRSGLVPAGADPDAYDRLRRRVLWSLPTGLYLLGTAAGARRNLTTCNWATQLATSPKLVGVSVENGVHTYELLREGRCFTLCLLGREDRAIVRKFVKPASDDREARTLSGVPYRDAPVSGAPIVASALAVLDCTLVHEVPLGSHTLFVGEVVDVMAPDGDGELAVLRMEDTRMSYGG